MESALAVEKRESRLSFRIPSADKDLIERAATLERESVTDFVLRATRERAREVIRDYEEIVLSERDFDRFLDALDAPPAPNEAFRRAAAEYRENSL